MITLTINGKKLRAKKGKTVLEVAQKEGIYIPTLCYHKDLTPYGGCRLCIVEVEGWPRPVTACTLPIEDGLVVTTDTPQLKKLRTFSLQLILSEHPHACLVCDKEEECAKYQECIQKSTITSGCKFCSRNGNCELQTLVDYLDIKEIPFDFNYRNLAVERFDPFFERDYNICILCGRCVRACQEVRNASVLDFHHRGQETLVGTAFNLSHLEIGCQFCGACVDICPTGALRDRYGKWLGLPERSVKTTCALCSIGCSITINCKGTSVVNATPDNNQICVRGRFGIAPLVHHPKRITTPIVKRGNRLVPVDWEEALQVACSQLRDHKTKTGILFSSQLSTDAIDSVYRFADHIKCHNLASSSAIEGSIKPVNVNNIEDDAVFIIVNTDMINDFSPLLLKLKSFLKKKTTFIVIDAVAHKLAHMADFWFRPKIGEEIDYLNRILTQQKMSAGTNLPVADLKFVKNVLQDRNIYLFYNPCNINNASTPQLDNSIILASGINTLKIMDMGVDTSATDLLENKNIDCLYLVGAAPRFNREYKAIIVQDCFLPQCDFDVFLPAATFAEIDGNVINIEGKVKKLRKAIEPRGNSKPDSWIINEMSTILKYDLKIHTPRKRKGLITTAHARTVKPSKKYPLHLIIRENCYSYRGTPLSLLMKGFEKIRGDKYVWINSSTARKLRIKDNADVKIIGKDMNFAMPARITDDIPPNSALIYYHLSMGTIKSHRVRLECIKF